MRWIMFSRVSTDMQLVERQVRECREYIQRNVTEGDEVVEIEEPETSTRLSFEDRPRLDELFKLVKRGDTVVVYKLDRLARDGEELVYIYKNKLIKKGVTIVSLSEPHIDKANIHIYAFIAETERDNISRNTKSGLKNKQSKGEMTGTAPYGWKTDPTRLQTQRDKVRSTGKPYLLIPCEHEQKNVSLMTTWRDQGYSYGEIVKELENHGATNRTGGAFNKTQVHRVISRLKTMPESLRELLPA